MSKEEFEKIFYEALESHYRSALSWTGVVLKVMEDHPEYRNEALLDSIGKYLEDFIQSCKESVKDAS